jgi:protein HOOK3
LIPSDEEYFRQPSRPSAQLSDNWVLRFASLKRLYRLITQYFADILHQPTSALDVPDLQAVAKGHDEAATLILCRLTIAIAVQSEKNKDVIDRIQRLTEAKQHILMKAIEQVNQQNNSQLIFISLDFSSLGHVKIQCGNRRQTFRERWHD